MFDEGGAILLKERANLGRKQRDRLVHDGLVGVVAPRQHAGGHRREGQKANDRQDSSHSAHYCPTGVILRVTTKEARRCASPACCFSRRWLPGYRSLLSGPCSLAALR